MTTSFASDAAAVGATAPKRVGGLKWSEVCERVQQPDGSVRTSPAFKSGAGSAASPPRPRPRGLGKINPPLSKATSTTASFSREGTSRGGSSGKSSRSSSRDALARDGDISSRCSSGGWDTSTNSSELSRPRTPPDVAPSPSGSSALLMPVPIRTMPMLPPALFDDEQEAKEGATSEDAHLVAIIERPGVSIKWDPFGRDNPRRLEVKNEWSGEPLAKYLKGVVFQIDTNLQNHCVPTTEKLDAFVSRLVGTTHRQMKHAPKRQRHVLQALFAKRLQKFWNFVRNEKVKSTSPEELKSALLSLIESLTTDFGVNPEVLVAQPRPRRVGGGTGLR
mmetsp:Transcript_58482/g.166315  ORF Transcript_58482/g.166315 Transcript_58482/m.166315 type:complete len:334 (-) Transcript_58482:247-1248(-)